MSYQIAYTFPHYNNRDAVCGYETVRLPMVYGDATLPTKLAAMKQNAAYDLGTDEDWYVVHVPSGRNIKDLVPYAPAPDPVSASSEEVPF